MKEYFVICGFNSDKKLNYLCTESCVGWYWCDVIFNANFYTLLDDAKNAYNKIINEKGYDGEAPYYLRCLAKLNNKKIKDIVNIKISKIVLNTEIENEILVEDKN